MVLLFEIDAASSWLVLPLSAAQPLPQFDENLRGLVIESNGSLLVLRGPGQPRLDSASPSAGWFPLPDAVGRLPPICPSIIRLR